jgi:outer membrane protein
LNVVKCVAGLLWVLPALVSAQDLLQVYAQARAADPLLAAEVANTGAVQQAAVIAGAPLWPQWSLNADRSETRGAGSGQAVSTSVSQVLLDLNRLRSHDAALSEAAAQNAKLRAAEQELAARVARGYFGVLSAQAALATAQANEDAFAAQVAQSQSRYAAGLSAQVDVDQALAYHALSRGGTAQARQQLADAQQALAQITGQTAQALQPLAEKLPAQPPEPSEPSAWVQRSWAAHPSLLAQAQVLRASEQRVNAARAEHAPTLSVVAEQGRRGDGLRRAEGQLALRLNLPLFAGGATQARVQQARWQQEAQSQTLQATQRALARETLAQFQAVCTAVELIGSTGAALAAAERALQSTRTGQSLGTRSFTDLLLAIQTHTAAQSAHQQARHAWALSTLLLAQAAGSLGLPELAAANQWLKGKP